MIIRFPGEMPPQRGIPALDASGEKFNRRPVLSTIFREKPFGQQVKGLSHCGIGACNKLIVFK